MLTVVVAVVAICFKMNGTPMGVTGEIHGKEVFMMSKDVP